MRADTGELVWKRWLLPSETAESEGAPLVIGTRVFVTTVRAPELPGCLFHAHGAAAAGAQALLHVVAGTDLDGTARRRATTAAVRAYTPLGRRVWARDLVGSTYAAMNYRNGSVYASTKRARLYKLSARTGRVRWVASTGQGEGYGECAVGRTRVYCTNLDGTVRSFTVRRPHRLAAPVWRAHLRRGRAHARGGLDRAPRFQAGHGLGRWCWTHSLPVGIGRYGPPWRPARRCTSSAIPLLAAFRRRA